MKKIIFVIFLSLLNFNFIYSAQWSYDKQDNWSGKCNVGNQQSPINIITKNSQSKDINLVINYLPKLKPTHIINNGHTVQVNFALGNTVSFNGVLYNLLQVHFHAPSEHQIDGKSFPLEAHFVHQNDKKELLVLGVFFTEGNKNKAFTEILEHAPKNINHAHDNDVNEAAVKALKGDLLFKESLPLKDLLPATLELYNYSGSLTTPTCDEGVNWVVFKNTKEVSSNEIKKFKELTVPSSNRKTQPINKRTIFSTSK
jgi:carbonic anhydrase